MLRITEDDYNELMDKIVKLRSPTNDSSYLFEKDEYVEGEEVDLLSNIKMPEKVEDTSIKVEDDFELSDIDDEELPDFLKDEQVDTIK